MLNKILDIVINITPKFNKVVIYSQFGLDGNAYGMYRFLLKENNTKIIFLSKAAHLANEYRKFNLKSYYAKSLLGLYHYFTSKHLYLTHPLNQLLKSRKRQLIIMLWHGMPIKKIGLLKKDEKEKYKNFKNIDFFISTSPFYANILSKAFMVDKLRILTCGQPSQDILLNYKKYPNEMLENVLVNYKNIITYCPTFRKADKEFSTSQTELKFSDIFAKYFSFDFLQFCKENQILFVIKLHPAELQGIELPDHSNLLVIKEDLYVQKGFTFYEVLARTSILINDISSIIIDYAVIDRPMLFIMDDFEEYVEKIGTVFDSYRSMIPGKIVNNKEELLTEIKNIFIKGDDLVSERRKIFNNVINSAVNGNACEDITKAIKGKI